MSRTTSRRLARLEMAEPPEVIRPWHQIIVEEHENEELHVAAMIASGGANETDNFIIVRIVSPPHHEAAS